MIRRQFVLELTQQAIRLRAALDRIESVLEALRVVALDSYFPGKRAKDVFSAMQAVENVSKIETRLPTELLPGTSVDVDPIDAWRHRPATTAVLLLAVGEQTSDDVRRVRAEAQEMFWPEWGGSAHEIAAEPDR